MPRYPSSYSPASAAASTIETSCSGSGAIPSLDSCVKRLILALREILRPALRSPVIRNRHFALRALSHWPAELMTAEVPEAIARVAERDPDADVRDEAAPVLRGEPIEPSEDE